MANENTPAARRRACFKGNSYHHRGVLGLTNWTWDRERKHWHKDGAWADEAAVRSALADLKIEGMLRPMQIYEVWFEEIP